MVANLTEVGEVKDMLLGVVDGMLEGLQIISPEWKYLYVNETVARHGKSTKEQLLGKTMMECYPGIENTPVFEQFKKCLDEQVSVRLENEFTYPDKTSAWFLLYIHPVQEGFMVLSVDITTQKLAEIILKEKIREVDVLMNSTTSRELRLAELKREIVNLKNLAESHVV